MKKQILAITTLTTVHLYSAQQVMAPEQNLSYVQNEYEMPNQAAQLMKQIKRISARVEMLQEQVAIRHPLDEATEQILTDLETLAALRPPIHAMHAQALIGTVREALLSLVSEIFDILTNGLGVVSKTLDNRRWAFAQQFGDLLTIHNILAAHLEKDNDYKDKLKALRNGLVSLQKRAQEQ